MANVRKGVWIFAGGALVGALLPWLIFVAIYWFGPVRGVSLNEGCGGGYQPFGGGVR